MPKFKIYHKDYSDEPHVLEAFDSEAAAIEYAQYYDQDSSLIRSSQEITVVSESNHSHEFQIGAYRRIVYYANPI